jgi:beta-phosphoglucomutase family hydrolase
MKTWGQTRGFPTCGKPAGSRRTPLAEGLALIFDMDGVIIHSNPMHREAWAAFNRRYGIETTDEMQERMYGRRNDQIVRDFFGDTLEPEEVKARGAAKEQLYREMIEEKLDELLVPGIREFLETYRGTPMGLASNADPPNVNFLLDRARLRPYFHAVVDGSQVTQPKPHPEIFLRAAGQLRTAPADCIVFEDSYSGVEAARAAGARIVGLSTTHGNLPGSNITVDNFNSNRLISWLAAQRPVTTG